MAGATPAPTWWWEDFKVGKVLTSGTVEVTREEVIAFASRYDPQRFHVDEAAAKETMFGGLIASGWMTAALSMRLMCDAYLLDSASLGSPGVEKLQWLKPVRPGDVLHVRTTVLEARPMASKPHIGLARSRMETLNQHGEAVMTMEAWGMYRRREPAA
ncbi:MaoC family dehydratase [Ideonella sp. BN130291]|nr:MaoC family dehydratase [Ideonella sp. BN130291]